MNEPWPVTCPADALRAFEAAARHHSFTRAADELHVTQAATRSEAKAIVRAGPGFSDSALVLQAAAEGHGVALGRMFLASADITAGRLVKPFALDLSNDYSYWLAYPQAAAGQPRVAAFRDWLLAETSDWRIT